MDRVAQQDKEFDIVVYGASGFTGRLVAEYLATMRGRADAPRWAMAGRNGEKLAAVRDEVGAPPDTPLIVADGADTASLAAMIDRTQVVLTTVGPYQLYGGDVVAICADKGAGYVDLCGEPGWMRAMIDAHEARARASGARIVFSCGFDSIPFDLGVWRLQARSREKYGVPATRARGLVRRMKGTFSGGTKASLEATVAAAKADPSLAALLRSPFSLTPGFEGPPQPSGARPEYDDALETWLAPFVMAQINTRNVHRSNFLLGHPYGRDFVYSEMLMTGPGERGAQIARAIGADRSGGMSADVKPGEGPSREEREAGSYDLLFVGETADGRETRVAVRGDKDPGYGSTSKMLSEAAMCLAFDRPELPGGFHTSAAAFGDALIDRLEAHGVMQFADE